MSDNDVQVLVTILGMAVVTYATRAGGLVLMSRFKLDRRVEAWLGYVPGTVLVSLIGPDLLRGGPAGWLAGVVTVLVAARTHNLLLAMAAGVGIVFGIRTFL